MIYLEPKRKMKFPLSAEREYYRVLRAMMRNMRKAVLEAEKQRTDASETEELMRRVKEIYASSGTKEAAIKELRRIFANVDKVTRQNIQNAFEECLMADVAVGEAEGIPLIWDEWEFTQKSLIDDVESSFFNKFAVLAGMGAIGSPTTSTETALESVCKAIDKRIKAIAVDQTGRLYGAVTKKYHEQSGVSFYKWQSRNDNKVRAEHRANNGKYFYWDRATAGEVQGVKINPTPKFAPGEDYGCRCSAVPIIADDIMNAVVAPNGEIQSKNILKQ